MLGTPSAVLAVLVVGVVVNGLLFYGVHSLRPTSTAAPPSSPPAQTEHTTTAELTTTEPRTSAERTPRPFFRLITNVLVRLSDNSGTAPIWTPTSGQNGPRGNHFATLNTASPNLREPSSDLSDSLWKGFSANFACIGISEVQLSLLRGLASAVHRLRTPWGTYGFPI